MTARVITPFKGVPDREVHPRAFVEGDVVEGDLARVAVEQGWAVDADTPVDELQSLTKPQLEKLAAERGVDIATAKTKADIIAALQAA